MVKVFKMMDGCVYIGYWNNNILEKPRTILAEDGHFHFPLSDSQQLSIVGILGNPMKFDRFVEENIILSYEVENNDVIKAYMSAVSDSILLENRE